LKNIILDYIIILYYIMVYHTILFCILTYTRHEIHIFVLSIVIIINSHYCQDFKNLIIIIILHSYYITIITH
jgi:hypothetical protein